ncbi:MAG TPA: Stp1/IreP family PP2C-type Ser/Thr phosphatase [Myxococcota bacterium]|nr:Stp1/IreP family PP2C-type Ser/Thr phosphatase [Myxococcota bacterium]
MVSSWARSNVGRRREKNEDSYLADPSLMLYLVADGMGGHAGGETASRMAVDIVHRSVAARRTDVGLFPASASRTEQPAILVALGEAIREASQAIFEASSLNLELAGMGTTATVALFFGPRIYVAHVGDSRLYRMRAGRLEQLTEDHSLVAEQVKAGFITAEEAQFSRFRNIITRSVGFESNVAADTFSVAVRPGDLFLLCSDGLTGMVSDEEIGNALRRKGPAKACDELVEIANRHGGEDNITLIVLRFKGPPGGARAARG